MLGLLAIGAKVSLAASIAVIDSGVDYKHVDLKQNVWSNPQESTTTDDNTVYKQDLHGWNFAENNNQVIDYKYLGTFPQDCYKIFEVQGKILNGTATQEEKDWYKAKKEDQTFLKKLQAFGNFVHGTHVSGISSNKAEKSSLIAMKLIPTEPPGIGGKAAEEYVAELRNRGVLDDNIMAKLMLGFMAKQQAGLLVKVGKYVKATHSQVANGSFGTSVAAATPIVANLLKTFTGKEPSPEEAKEATIYFIDQIILACKDFVGAAPNTLFVFAAGNDGTNNDQLPVSPANIKTNNTIAVAATNGDASLATFSNFGSQKVEVAAPGVVIDSTIPGDEHLKMSGTSMAAPYVTNVAGLIIDENNRLTPADVKKILMETVDVKPFLSGKVASSGIVNKKRAVFAARLSVKQSLESAIAQSKRMIAESRHQSVTPALERDMIVLPLSSPF